MSQIQESKENTCLVTFYNNTHDAVRLYLKSSDNNLKDQDFGIISDNEVKKVASFQNDIWYISDIRTHEKLQHFKIKGNDSVFYLSLLPNKESVNKLIFQNYAHFAKAYKQINGRDWITVYPRCKTMHNIIDPVKIGNKRTIRTSASFIDAPTAQQEFFVETFSLSPKIFLIENCLSAFEADSLIEMSKGRLQRSTIISEDGSGLVESKIRTSSTCWLRYSENKLVENIFDRISDILGIDRDFVKYQASESLQIVHYKENQEFKHHHDYLDPVSHYGNNSVMRGNNRMATFLFYLSASDEGGETHFPLCNVKKDGVAIKLPKGSAILFYNMLPDGNLDEKSLHAGLPVEKGEKFIANLWVWDRVYK